MNTQNSNLSCRNGQVVMFLRGKRWNARIKLPTGQWHRVSTKKTELEEAKIVACEKLDEFKFRDRNQLAIVSKKFSSVAQAAADELEALLISGHGKKMYSHYIGVIYRYLIPYFGDLNIDTIDHHKLAGFDEWRAQKVGHQPRRSTINNHNAALNKVFDYALRNKWVHPLRIPSLRNNGTKAERRPSFSLAEYKELCEYMRHWSGTGKKELTRQIRTLLRDYVLILANTGMRHGTESRNLKWCHVEQIHADGERYFRIWVNGKTGKRELVANYDVIYFFNRIRNRFTDLADLDYEQLFQIDEFIFRLENGDRPRDLHGAFEILMQESGLWKDKHGDKRTLYSLRHTYATSKLMFGISIHVLAKQMGTSVQMIEQHYSHLIPSMSVTEIIGR